MDITFNCDKCGQRIAIDAAGAGMAMRCPKCGQSLSVPMAVAVPAGTATPQSRETQPPLILSTKQCPLCAETIKSEARVCRFCGYNLETGQPGRASHPENVSPPVVEAQSSVKSGVKLGVGMFIVLPAIIIGVIIAGVVLLLFLGLLTELMSFLWDHLIVVLSILVPTLVIIWAVFALVRKRGNAAHSRVLVVSGILFVVAVSYQAWIGYKKENAQGIANSFVGITEQELIRRLGQPREIQGQTDSPFRSLVYDESESNTTVFIIDEKDGVVAGGSYRGCWIHR
ncbi:MAG: zinc ribbon domain-containing protein [Verrucomicrobiia bacterium]|jgi:hypothetical protein